MVRVNCWGASPSSHEILHYVTMPTNQVPLNIAWRLAYPPMSRPFPLATGTWFGCLTGSSCGAPPLTGRGIKSSQVKSECQTHAHGAHLTLKVHGSRLRLFLLIATSTSDQHFPSTSRILDCIAPVSSATLQSWLPLV